MDGTVQSVHAFGVDMEVTKFYTLVSVMHNDGGPCQEITQWIGLAQSLMDLHSMSIWLLYLCRLTKI